MLNLEVFLSKGSFRLPLKCGTELQLVRRDGKLMFKRESTPTQSDDKLGLITSGPGGAKLQAIETLHILPGSSQANLSNLTAGGSFSEQYKLEPIIGGRCEIILLRPGDVIVSPGTNGSVSCVWLAPGVQVNSSAAELNQADPSETKSGVDETADAVTPDGTVTEVPVTQPVTQPTKSQLSATPHLPKDRSMIVHETPTANRILEPDDFSIAPLNEDCHVEAIPPPQGAIAVTETFSTARTGQSPNTAAQDLTNTELATYRKRPQNSPEVRVNGRRPRKRQSPEPSPSPEVTPAADGPPVKRTRITASIEGEEGDTVQASPLDNIIADPNRMTYSAKAKRRTTIVSDATPTKSSRNSQRSATATTVAAYEGDSPRVATSNSAIKDDSPTVKFLRKHGGALVKSVEDKCNILCVRDGGLSKTMKVIQAIALGVPIVTDKWLTESAKAEGFLDLSSFKPSVAQQEKDWKFDLDKVWGVAQTPFKGYAIYFTPTLKKTYTNFREMDRVCQTFGAKVIPKRSSKNDKTIVFAAEEDDPDADKMFEDGETCYHKDLLTTSILRGNLDLDSDEFKIKAKHVGPRRKGHRKST